LTANASRLLVALAAMLVAVGAIAFSSLPCTAGEQTAPVHSQREGPVSAEPSKLENAPLICLWQHDPEVDIAPLVKELGFNTVWTDDPEYTGQRWEDTQMYQALQVPGIDNVIPKIERAAWGWTQEESLKTARWIADLSLEHEGIIGLYLNDFYDEIEDGHRTMEQWREIIAAVKSVNPDLDLWVPHYPHRGNEEREFDIDYQGVIFNVWDPRNAADADRYLTQAATQHAGKTILGGLYLSSGPRRGRWLAEEDFKSLLRLYVNHINAGRLHGLRIFSAGQLDQRPEYIEWAKEVLADLKAAQ